MFLLTNRLALSNLIKNRKLYYPYALATILAIAITYIFTSLTLNPHLDNLTGADSIKAVLGMGLGIVALFWDYCSLCQQLCYEKSFKGAWSL